MEEPTLDYQKVGEAFVLQYYTQMHKDPSQMYKFYQDSSTFVHGDSEMGKGELIVGKTVRHSIHVYNFTFLFNCNLYNACTEKLQKAIAYTMVVSLIPSYQWEFPLIHYISLSGNP